VRYSAHESPILRPFSKAITPHVVGCGDGAVILQYPCGEPSLLRQDHTEDHPLHQSDVPGIDRAKGKGVKMMRNSRLTLIVESQIRAI
jgi:hypothetical protein